MRQAQQIENDIFDRKLSERLIALRVRRGWALEELAGASGISRATLSRIERGQTSPTATQLGRLCTAFGITMSRLLSEIDGSTSDVVRAADQGIWIDPATGFRRRMVSPPSEGLRIELVEGELPAGAVIAYDAPPIAGLEQHVWMMAGALRLSYGEATQTLLPGDCLRFRIWDRTRFETVGDAPARYLIAVSRPS